MSLSNLTVSHPGQLATEKKSCGGSSTLFLGSNLCLDPDAVDKERAQLHRTKNRLMLATQSDKRMKVKVAK